MNAVEVHDVGEPGAHARDRRRPTHLDAVLELCARWEIRATVVGRVTDTGRFRVFDGLFDAVGVPGENPPPPLGDDAARGRRPTATPIADVPVGSLGDGPLYHRPLARPADAATRCRPPIPAPQLARQVPRRRRPLGRAARAARARRPSPTSRGCRASTTTSCSSTPSSGPGGDAAVLRVKGTTQGARARDRRQGALLPRSTRAPARRLVVLEAARNVACVGRRPARARELPQLRQPRAPRGDVAVLRGRRRHERGVRGARHPGHRRQRQLLQRVARRRHRPHAGRRRARADRRARRVPPPAPRCATATRIVRARRDPTPSSAARSGPPSCTASRRHAAGRRPRRRAARCTTLVAELVARRATVDGVHDVLRRRARGRARRDGDRRRRAASTCRDRRAGPRSRGSPSRRRASCSRSSPTAVDAVRRRAPAPPACPRHRSAPPAATASSPTAPSTSPSPTPTARLARRPPAAASARSAST